jgi:Electron transfer DM13
MRHLSIICIFTIVQVSVLFSACSKDETDTPPVNQSFKGEFVSGAHSTSGVASIDSNETTLTLTNFKSSSGPDLNIYIASSISNVTADYIDLGDIKGLKGTYTYDLPGNKDYLSYKYVVVWCVDFDVNFGYAELEMQ